jgi:hypothetical protein
VRRVLLLVTVALVMAALVVLASPAFAAPGGQGDENRAMPRETGQTPGKAPALSESPRQGPHRDILYVQRPLITRDKGQQRVLSPNKVLGSRQNSRA